MAQGREGPCSGDYGASLSQNRRVDGADREILFGMLAKGTELCSKQGFPVIVTNIAYYVEWILDTITD